MSVFELVAVSLMGIAACSGCSTTSPQQNLDDQLKAMVGKSLDVPRYHLRSELLLEQRELSNDILQLRYRYSGDCVLVVEVNSETRIVTNAWAKGSEKSCKLVP